MYIVCRYGIQDHTLPSMPEGIALRRAVFSVAQKLMRSLHYLHLSLNIGSMIYAKLIKH